MFVKLAVLVFHVVLATAAYTGPLAGGLPAAQYPAGVDPQSCPNYPNCNTGSITVGGVNAAAYNALPGQQLQYAQQAAPQYAQQAAPQYAAAPQYNSLAQQYSAPAQYQGAAAQNPQYSSAQQNALNRGEYIGDGDYHGEGLIESGATQYAGQPAAQAYSPVAQAYNPTASYQSASSYPAYSQYQAAQAAPQGLAAYNQLQYQPQAAQGAAADVGHAARFPAGLDPRACPNYPFCT